MKPGISILKKGFKSITGNYTRDGWYPVICPCLQDERHEKFVLTIAIGEQEEKQSAGGHLVGC